MASINVKNLRAPATTLQTDRDTNALFQNEKLIWNDYILIVCKVNIADQYVCTRVHIYSIYNMYR